MQPHNITLLANNHLNNKRKLSTNDNIDHTNNNKHIFTPPPRTHGSTAQACAACKYQRRKCTPDCVLAPYFPHDRQRQFLNAHRLFGVSNIVKIVKHLQPPAKDHAMRTIIFQSDARAADPVGGCYRIIRDLEQRIMFAQAELDYVLHHVALCRNATPTPHQQVQEMPVLDERKSAIGWDEKRRVYGNGESSSLPNDVRKVSLEDGINSNFDQLSCNTDDNLK